MTEVRYPAEFLEKATEIQGACLGDHCRRCMQECIMMNDFGDCPKTILTQLTEEGRLDPLLAFSCNGCGNCTAVCPKQLPLADIFMGARDHMTAANGGHAPFPGHKANENHQRFGFSPLFCTAKAGPDLGTGKRYGFMAGCSLSSSSPDAVEQTLLWLKTQYPDLSAVQKCCGLPTRNMGQKELFDERFAGLQKDLDGCGIDTLIVACQNCRNVINRHGHTPTVSLWELLPQIGIPEHLRGKGKDSTVVFTIHDSCPTRSETGIHDGIRWLMDELGYKYVEAEYSRENTRCCGAGGMVKAVNPDVTERVIERRMDTLPSNYVVVYCGTCRSFLDQGGAKAYHILDLLWGPAVTADGPVPDDVLSHTAAAWKNRYVSKKKLNRTIESPTAP